MSLSFRDATEVDLPAVVALLADDALGASREDTSLPLAAGYAKAFKAIAATPYQRLVVATHDGVVIGTMQILLIPAVSRQGSWRGQIEAVRIASHLRGSGKGEAFVNWAVEQCRSAGCVSVQLTSDNARPDAQRFWRRIGFLPTHVGFKISRDLLDIAEKLNDAGAGLRSLAEPWADTTSPAGRMVLTVFAGIAEFERELIHQRTSSGRVAAKARGVRFGRPPMLTADQVALGQRLVEEGTSVREASKLLKCHHATLYRALNTTSSGSIPAGVTTLATSRHHLAAGQSMVIGLAGTSASERGSCMGQPLKSPRNFADAS